MINQYFPYYPNQMGNIRPYYPFEDKLVRATLIYGAPNASRALRFARFCFECALEDLDLKPILQFYITWLSTNRMGIFISAK